MNFVVRLRGIGKRDLAKIGCEATATRIICQCKLVVNALKENQHYNRWIASVGPCTYYTFN